MGDGKRSGVSCSHRSTATADPTYQSPLLVRFLPSCPTLRSVAYQRSPWPTPSTPHNRHRILSLNAYKAWSTGSGLSPPSPGGSAVSSCASRRSVTRPRALRSCTNVLAQRCFSTDPRRRIDVTASALHYRHGCVALDPLPRPERLPTRMHVSIAISHASPGEQCGKRSRIPASTAACLRWTKPFRRRRSPCLSQRPHGESRGLPAAEPRRDGPVAVGPPVPRITGLARWLAPIFLGAFRSAWSEKPHCLQWKSPRLRRLAFSRCPQRLHFWLVERGSTVATTTPTRAAL